MKTDLEKARETVPECGPSTQTPAPPSGPRHQESCSPSWACGRHAAIAATVKREREETLDVAGERFGYFLKRLVDRARGA
ncbi:MAG: hypothetical protein M3547_01020 [Acidobacteriota bacterium]|nr:hypothetical protein [Acidobacteriota bacterium]